ncbi:hypothetical protein AX16_003780 [Volvariella volvacea WC 439]|nr:hypothetical protein AX16_003780 [Volvariella volvacea WC 439]
MVALANSQSQYIWNSKRSEQKSISRHAQPSGPWPWLDASTSEEHMKTDDKSAEWRPAEWIKYPRSCFPNWMDNQVKSSGIGAFIQDAGSSCTVHRAEVDGKGSLPDGDDLEVTNDTDDFLRSNLRFFMREKGTNLGNKQDKTEPAGDSQGKGTPIEALFIRNLSGEVLKWLGHHYKIEPFFFSSAINRTASHFQEDRIEVDGAYHITIVLPFVRCEAWDPAKRKLFSAPSTASLDTVAEQKIDTYAPLLLGSNKKVLFPDLLAVHLVRNDNGHTMISYHPKDDDSKNNEAKHLRDRVILAGESVYWRHIFPQDRRDPNYWLLILLWFVLYAWDESLDELYSHICYLVRRLTTCNHEKITDQLHVIQAHLLHYISLLEDFQKTVDFVLAAHKNVLPKGTSVEDTAMARECQTLKDEVGRLQSLRNVQESRVKNVMKLLFSQVNITENSQMKSLAETSSRDSAGTSERLRSNVKLTSDFQL